ncbi:MAG: PAS domain S-box protein [Paenacidovorax caeni]
MLSSRKGIFVTDTRGVILRVNRSFTEITGYSAEEARGQTPALMKSGRHENPDFYAAMQGPITTAGAWSGEIWNRRKSGAIFPEWLTITAVKTEAGEVTRINAFSTSPSTRRPRRKSATWRTTTR